MNALFDFDDDCRLRHQSAQWSGLQTGQLVIEKHATEQRSDSDLAILGPRYDTIKLDLGLAYSIHLWDGELAMAQLVNVRCLGEDSSPSIPDQSNGADVAVNSHVAGIRRSVVLSHTARTDFNRQ